MLIHILLNPKYLLNYPVNTGKLNSTIRFLAAAIKLKVNQILTYQVTQRQKSINVSVFTQGHAPCKRMLALPTIFRVMSSELFINDLWECQDPTTHTHPIPLVRGDSNCLACQRKNPRVDQTLVDSNPHSQA